MYQGKSPHYKNRRGSSFNHFISVFFPIIITVIAVKFILIANVITVIVVAVAVIFAPIFMDNDIYIYI